MSRYCKELRGQIGFASTCDDATPSKDEKGTIFWITYTPGVDDDSAGPDKAGQLCIAVNEAHTWLLFHRGDKAYILDSVWVTPDKRLLNAAHARLYDCKDTFVYRLSTRLNFTRGVWIGYDQRSDTAECVRSEWTSMLCGEFLAGMKSREELKQHPVEWAVEDASELVQLGREKFEEAEAARNAAGSQASEGGTGGDEGSISSLSLAPPSEGTGEQGGKDASTGVAGSADDVVEPRRKPMARDTSLPLDPQ